MKAADRNRSERLEKIATRWAVGLVIAGLPLALLAGVLGAAEVYPYEYAETVALIALLVPIGLALLIGAVGGLYLMGGWKIAPFGVVFVGGFAALTYGLVVADVVWRDIGVGLLAFSGAVFYLAGVLAARVPRAALNLWGNVGAVVGGAALAVLGHLTGFWGLLLFGAMAFGCAAGGLLGRWLARSAAH
jgi:hypothetical protein